LNKKLPGKLKTIKITVFFNSTLHHFSQLLAGLEFLSYEKKIDLQYKLELGKYPIDTFRIEMNGLNVFFDLSDNSRIYDSLYNQCDFYVKRMLLKADLENYERLIPYGLYYPVYFKNRSLKYLFLKDSKLLKFSLKYWNSISRLLDIKDCIAVNEISRLESEPTLNSQIIFRARLWNPANNDIEWKKNERLILNTQRIEINRMLNKEFEPYFIGGILKDRYSEKLCPDLLLPDKEYHRKTYIKSLKKASIGISNQGLEDSIGAKMGEYVANSIAILTTPIQKFELPGSFKEGDNYLTYTNVNECRGLIKMLFDRPDLCQNIQMNNSKYYKEYLHPGKKVNMIIHQIINA
jgi:hypothetical protein